MYNDLLLLGKLVMTIVLLGTAITCVFIFGFISWCIYTIGTLIINWFKNKTLT